LLPVHVSGNVGINGTLLTVLGTPTTNAAGEITAITFSGAGTSDASAVLQYDKFQFSDNVSGQPNLRFLTFIGHFQSNSPVQFAASASAASDGSGHVTVTLYPPLLPGAVQASSSDTMNINVPIVAGMTVTALPSHRAGVVHAGEPVFLAMPTLPTQEPFYSASEFDEDTGVSMRCYWGTVLGQNQQIMAHDCIWGYTMVPEYAMSVIFPL
jgi:hypothetical protein